MASSLDSKRAIGKKMVIACDGYDDSVFAPPAAQIPSNVTRIVRAIKHKDDTGIPQIVFYQRGVGANGDEEDKVLGGATGAGLSEHVREAYGFLANNFDPESQDALNDVSRPIDEIVLLGFSRGAFTARAISSLVSDVGLLTRAGMESFWGIFGDWMKQNVKGRQSEWFESRFGKKVSFTDPVYRETLIEHGITRWPMPIRAVGVWDTVGGSYPDAGISNITLAWMISQFEETDGGILTFDPAYLDFLQDMNNQYYIKQKEPIRPWALGKLYDSAPHNTVKGIVAGLAPIVRTPGRYHVVDDKTGLQTNIRLKNTCECIHPSVRIRMDSGGLGTEEDSKHVSEVSHLLNAVKGLVGLTSSKYSSAALKNYDLVESAGVKSEATRASGVAWRARDGGEGLPEEELGRTEVRLLKRSVDVAGKV
ncbi:Uncharacterized protein LAWI1_G000955 [Lachnellula willkommii]|uniref:T6SS Phospholipase effector Tle1-like catalytic domain-containing protein n=1 Tax=Lachnellula willkommii TaxID=215461 RepID=A0A559MLF7_9HELO|nr:Uncharacterized protein LAWI1_G000955 [Lachnellula willkommii]